jgi:hypothetical protein
MVLRSAGYNINDFHIVYNPGEDVSVEILNTREIDYDTVAALVEPLGFVVCKFDG